MAAQSMGWCRDGCKTKRKSVSLTATRQVQVGTGGLGFAAGTGGKSNWAGRGSIQKLDPSNAFPAAISGAQGGASNKNKCHSEQDPSLSPLSRVVGGQPVPVT